ncbi:Mrp/NBP35 family ATP-binding protein [Candidatus Paracaedibacter symbiosus]|uniref:Mrp/NBP35 family ATP-binding protein n=1 Tax=Candidatus Paracaedibacter symbiosus TaxID=244582 RepID=UPI00094EF495|nr:Mrp/NBP35 family ATP-binding protein [Candidatus Paracaedibacter symbiosus]
MIREDLLRDFLNTVSIPETNEPLFKYALVPSITEDRVQLMFEVPASLLTKVQALLPQVESWLKQTFPTHQIFCGITAEKTAKIKTKLTLEKVEHIICVASGKGGVGKSTTALNLAIALQQQGKRVGILDADIYGPSLPQMLNLTEKPSITSAKKLIPLNQYGLQALSIGLMIPADSPVIWRGPMVQGALIQLLKEADWDVDILVIDMPPGTGDAHLTLTQQVSVSGAVIVSTPQDVALIDAKRAISMFQRVAVPILGIIENMSFFECPNCHHQSHIFHHAGAKLTAEALDVPFLGEIPIDIDTRIGADTGKPITVFEPDHLCSKIYRQIAVKVLEQLSQTSSKHIQFEVS